MTDMTFKDFDKFQRKDFADRLTTVIKTFYPFYDDAFVLGLNAKYGAGKTTFLKMWQRQLEVGGHTVIYINAWETDFDDEPLVPIISSLLDGVKKGKGLKKLKTALRGTLGTVALASNNLLGHATGINVNKIMQEVDADLKTTNIQAIGEELYKEYSFKQKAYSTLKSELSAYVENIDEKPLTIFVDELDRVRPDYAVKFLEAIKHIFSLQGVCFVLAVDREQLNAAVVQLYGDIDFENYYRRFITREAQLPDAAKLELMPFIEDMASIFFDEKRQAGMSFPFKQDEQKPIMRSVCTACRAFNFAPRQIETFFRIFSQLMAVTQTERTARMTWVEAAIILIAIFIANRSLYSRIGAASASPTEIYEYLKSLDYTLPPHNYNEQDTVLTAMAFCLRSDQKKEHDEIAKICQNYDLSTKTHGTEEEKRAAVIGYLSRTFNGGRGHLSDQSPFQKIYSMMEEWRAFIE